MKTNSKNATIQPRFRVLRGGDIALGPGRVELLEEIQKTGSIVDAAEALGMSYMRAWTLIKTTEQCFREPLLHVSRGGAGHGGAKLTAHGLKVVQLYREMEKAGLRATAVTRRQLLKLLRP